MEKFAVVLTSNFPFGKGDDFLETELPWLRQHFDKIVILARNREAPQTRAVPDGVEIHRFTKVDFLGKLNYLRIPFMSEFRRELQRLRRSGQIELTVKRVRGLISFMTHGLHMKRILAQILRQHGKLTNSPGVVLYAYWMEFPVYAALSLKQQFPEFKVVCRSHRCDLYWDQDPLGYLPLRAFIADNIDAAYFISEEGRSYFTRQNRLPNEEKFKIARLGVRSGNGLAKASDDGVLRVLSCSYTVPVKRVDLIIRSLARITKFAVEWTHIGDGTELAEWKSLAAQLLQPHVNIKYEFRGFMSNAMVYDYYQNQRVDVLVNVSSSEGVPVSMMEAFAFGVPVLATAVGGVPEMVNEFNGMLLPAEVGAEEVADALRKIRSLSAPSLRALRSNAYETWRRSYDASVNYEMFAKNVLEVAGLA